MDIRGLKYFLAVYEEASVSAAAKRCFVAQPSISTTLAKLEEHLGVRLFLRHRKGVTPTPEATKFYEHVRRLLSEFDALGDIFQSPQEQIPFSLAVMPTIDSGRTSDFLKVFLKNAPQLSLRLVELSESADARLISDRLVNRDERFVHMWDENYVVALPEGHRLTLNSRIELDDLNGVRLIERCMCEAQDEVASALARHKVRPSIVARANTEDWAVALVSAGLGVAIVPEGTATGKGGIVVRPLHRLKLVRKVGLAYDPSTASASLLMAAIKEIRSKTSGTEAARPLNPFDSLRHDNRLRSDR